MEPVARVGTCLEGAAEESNQRARVQGKEELGKTIFPALSPPALFSPSPGQTQLEDRAKGGRVTRLVLATS